MLISIIIAIPIGILVARYKRLYLPIITVSGLLYTIPSIAAFVLLIPITGVNLFPFWLSQQLLFRWFSTTCLY